MKPNAVGELGEDPLPVRESEKTTTKNCDSFMIERVADRGEDCDDKEV